MYSQRVIDRNRARFDEKFKHLLPRGLRTYTVPECEAWVARLNTAWDPRKKRQVRELDDEEQGFVRNELLLTKIDFRYWAERYCTINRLGAGVGPLFPLHETQRYILHRMGQLEDAIHAGERRDGILLNVLKGIRQVGASTLFEALGAHRATTQDNIYGLIASDVPDEEGSGYLFGMFELIVDSLPWWLSPAITDRQKNKEIRFDGGSHFWVGAGKSMKGAQGTRGQLGRGKSLSWVHLSELSTWETPEQIDDALLPTMHKALGARLFAGFESTGKGRNNWWHRHFNIAQKSVGRFVNVFITWYVARETYSAIPPAGWAPSEDTLQVARRIEETSGRYYPDPISPTREQLYWYESTKAYYEEKGALGKFFEEYGALEPEECFQFSGRQVFPPELIARIQSKARPLLGVYEVASFLKYSQRVHTHQDEVMRAREEAPPGGHHLHPLLGQLGHPHVSSTPGGVADGVGASGEILRGYGFRPVPRAVWQRWTVEEFKGHLLVWQLPEEGYVYVVSGDVGEGIGEDNSSVDVTRVGTLTRGEEQVAQLVADDIDPIDLAYILDAIGRFYGSVEDGGEALMAIEYNNHGIATLSEIRRHCGYENHYIWQYEDAADPAKRFTNRVGWYTNQRTRPLLLTRYIKKVNSWDEVTGEPDYRINSPFTLQEFRDFQTEGRLWEGEADPTNPDATDDSIMGGAIGVFVCQTLQEDQGETLDMARKRIQAQLARERAATGGARLDYRNTEATAQDMDGGVQVWDQDPAAGGGGWYPRI